VVITYIEFTYFNEPLNSKNECLGLQISIVAVKRPVGKTFIPLTLSESFTGAAKTLSETLREF
jgi:hypothetical protein